MMGVYRAAKRVCNYNATYFLNMLHGRRGFAEAVLYAVGRQELLRRLQFGFVKERPVLPSQHQALDREVQASALPEFRIELHYQIVHRLGHLSHAIDL